MSEHPTATRVREWAATLGSGGLHSALEAYSEDAIYRVGGRSPLAGTYRGHAAIAVYFTLLAKLTGGTLRFGVTDVLGSDHHAVMCWSANAERNGRVLDFNGAMAFRLNDEGKFTETWFLTDDQAAVDTFLTGE